MNNHPPKWLKAQSTVFSKFFEVMVCEEQTKEKQFTNKLYFLAWSFLVNQLIQYLFMNRTDWDSSCEFSQSCLQFTEWVDYQCIMTYIFMCSPHLQNTKILVVWTNFMFITYIVLLSFFESLKASSVHSLWYNTLFKMYSFVCMLKLYGFRTTWWQTFYFCINHF